MNLVRGEAKGPVPAESAGSSAVDERRGAISILIRMIANRLRGLVNLHITATVVFAGALLLGAIAFDRWLGLRVSRRLQSAKGERHVV